MERITSVAEAYEIMSGNFIGPADLLSIASQIALDIPDVVPPIPYSKEQLARVANTHILIWFSDKLQGCMPMNIRQLKVIFGKDPAVKEPCFYNQDWYDGEDFTMQSLKSGWYLLQKEVGEDSRAVNPDALAERYVFPSALLCTYAFFVLWLCRGEKLWYHDFVWCSDKDHNGDRVYVGKYHDIDGVNKNGFSIHRHLALRPCYGAVSTL